MTHARVTRIKASPDRLDEMVSQFEEHTVPVLKDLDGHRGYLLMGDRASGWAMAVTFWESEEAMRASEDAVTEERERAARTGEASGGPEIERLEVMAQA